MEFRYEVLVYSLENPGAEAVVVAGGGYFISLAAAARAAVSCALVRVPNEQNVIIRIYRGEDELAPVVRTIAITY